MKIKIWNILYKLVIVFLLATAHYAVSLIEYNYCIKEMTVELIPMYLVDRLNQSWRLYIVLVIIMAIVSGYNNYVKRNK